MSKIQHGQEVERTPEPQIETAEELQNGNAHGGMPDPMRAILLGSDFEQGQALLRPEDTLLGDLFRRIDQSGDQGIDRAEVIAHLKRVGIKSGFLGLVHQGIADKFMENLDTNSDTRVTMDEFGPVARELLPADLFDENGGMHADKLENFLSTLDTNNSGGIDHQELFAGSMARLPDDTSHKKIIADAAAKLGIDALDTDKTGEIDLVELQKAAEAVAATRDSGG